MMFFSKTPLLAAIVALSMTMVACSDNTATDTNDSATTDNTAASAASDKLETKFVTIATHSRNSTATMNV